MSYDVQRNYIWIIPWRGQRMKYRATHHEPSNSCDPHCFMSPPVTDVNCPLICSSMAFSMDYKCFCQFKKGTNFLTFYFYLHRKLAPPWKWSLPKDQGRQDYVQNQLIPFCLYKIISVLTSDILWNWRSGRRNSIALSIQFLFYTWNSWFF